MADRLKRQSIGEEPFFIAAKFLPVFFAQNPDCLLISRGKQGQIVFSVGEHFCLFFYKVAEVTNLLLPKKRQN